MSASSMAKVFPLCSSGEEEYAVGLGIPRQIQMGTLSEKLPPPYTCLPALCPSLAVRRCLQEVSHKCGFSDGPEVNQGLI